MINRRNWLKKSAMSSSAIALAPFTSHFLPKHRNYFLGEEKMLRLHWNENPYGASSMALDAAKNALSISNHYPDDHIDKLKSGLSKRYECDKNQILITAGSTEILCLLGQEAGLRKGHLLMSDRSFPTIAFFAQSCGVSVNYVPMASDDQIDLEGVLESIDSDTSVVFICNPNNPTSTDHQKSDLITFMEKAPEHVLVCVDEAYIQFSRDGDAGSMIDQVNKFKNLVVVRTFSKAYGLAGMRVGYAVTQPSIVTALSQRHLGGGFVTGLPSVTACLAALNDDSHVQMVVDQNQKGREIVYEAFGKWGVPHAKSATNFIYAKSHLFHSDVLDQLKKEGILITKWPWMKDHIRISIGKPQEMLQFVESVEPYLL